MTLRHKVTAAHLVGKYTFGRYRMVPVYVKNISKKAILDLSNNSEKVNAANLN